MPKSSKGRRLLRAVLEIICILFLFYSNLLMGEFIRSRHVRSFSFALRDVITPANFLIGVCAGLIGYLAFEYLRSRLGSV
jgi:hypothetical protein